MVIRKTATRAYVNAYRYDYQIASGPAADNLAAFFSFGKNPSSYGGTPIAAYVIEYEASPTLEEEEAEANADEVTATGDIKPGWYQIVCDGDCPPREHRVHTVETGRVDYAGGCNHCGSTHTWTPIKKVTFHVEVNTYGDGTKDGEPVWTGNAVKHEAPEIAETAAKDLFGRWTAVKFWRVINSNGTVISTNYEGEAS